ncbi:APC family permease [Rhodanobacter sp. BL-MT-08]
MTAPPAFGRLLHGILGPHRLTSGPHPMTTLDAAADLAGHAPAQPRRHLGIRHGIAMCAGMVIGSGIFKSTPTVAASISSPTGLFLVWMIGGALSFCGALCFAEMAAAFPDAGGDYHFLHKAYGRKLAFLFAWSRFAVIHTGFIAILAYVFADYVNEALPLGQHGTGFLAVGTIVLLCVINLRGVRTGMGAQTGFVAVVVCGMLALGAAGVWMAIRGMPPLNDAPVPAASAYGSAMIFVMLAYGGWSDAATLSSELRAGPRGIVMTLIGGMSLVTVLYTLVNWAYVRCLGHAGLAASNAPAATAMQLAFGRTGEWLVVGAVAVTSIAVINALLIAGARTTYAVARDSGLLGSVGEWDGARGIPATALLTIGGVALVEAAVAGLTHGAFATLVDFVSPVYWFFLVLSGAAVIVLRFRFPDAPRPFKVPLYPFLPILFCATSVYVLYATLAYVKAGALVGIVVLAFGMLLLPWFGKARKRAHPLPQIAD